MPTVQHRTPVVVRHPVTEQHIAVYRGLELDDADPLVKAYPWLFVPDDTPSGRIESVSIEAATAAPGEKRSTRRA
jgi:hypothetical protein